MELRRYLRLVRQRWMVVVLTLIVGLGAGYVATNRTAIYSSSATVYVGSRQLSNDPQQLYGTTGLDQIAQTFAEMLPNPVIAQEAIEATHAPRQAAAVAAATSATVRTNTTLIDVTVHDADPVVAQELANGIVDAFVKKVSTYDQASSGPGTLPTEPAYVFQPAFLSTAPIPTGATSHAVVGGVFGLVVALLIVALLDYLDISIKSPEELERRLGIPLIGVIPYSVELAYPDTPAAPRRAVLATDNLGAGAKVTGAPEGISRATEGKGA